jgi:hypothetical protein
MFKRLTYAIVLFAMLFATGGQWAVLQSIAWTTMLADNLHSSSLKDAVTKTFDGKHPCCICKTVHEGRSEDQKKEFSTTSFKLEFPPLAENPALATPPLLQLFIRENITSESLFEKPATPPPRSRFV